MMLTPGYIRFHLNRFNRKRGYINKNEAVDCNKSKMMQTILIEKLRSYIIQNNVDLLLKLQRDFSVTRYLEDKIAGITPQLDQWVAEGKPQYIIEELCMNELTKDLRPSKFNYIREILEEDFLQTYEKFRDK